jgi:hypothetical protein
MKDDQTMEELLREEDHELGGDRRIATNSASAIEAAIIKGLRHE